MKRSVKEQKSTQNETALESRCGVGTPASHDDPELRDMYMMPFDASVEVF